MDVSSTKRHIKTMRIQGARELAKAGVKMVHISAKKSRARNRETFIRELQKLSGELSKLRPTEPALRNALNAILLKVSKAPIRDMGRLKAFTLKACEGYLRDLASALEKVAGVGAGQIEEGDTVLTHCHSHAVIAILRKAKKQGKSFTVIVTETRPMYQGIMTAKELLRSGIKVTYCTDGAVGYVMKKVDKVLVGCDAILADGSIVNKIGTFPMAVVAERFGVPVYVAGGTYKFDPMTVMGVPEPIEQRDPKEVISPKKLPGARVINPAFDLTPAEYIHALITEKGITRPEVVRQLL